MPLFILAILLLLPVPGWGTVYYVSLTGSNTVPYDTPAKAANLPITALNSIKADATGFHTMYVNQGTYSLASGSLNFNNANANGMQMLGCTDITDLSTCGPAAEPLVIFNETGSDQGLLFAGTTDNVTIKYLTVKASGAKYAILASGGDGIDSLTLDHVTAQSNADHTLTLTYFSGATNLTIKNCTFRYIFINTRPALWTEAGTSGSISYSKFEALTNNYYDAMFFSHDATTVTVNNVYVSGATRAAIYKEGTGTATVSNSIISFSPVANNTYPITRTAGTLELVNNILIGNPYSSGLIFTGTVTDTNNLENVTPKFTSYGRKGYVIPSIDDSSSLAYAQTLESLLSARGYKGTYFIEQAAWNASNNAALRTLVTNGVFEVGSHGYSHSDLSLADGADIWTFTGCTVAMDRTGTGTITVTGTPGGPISNVLTTTLATIRAALVSAGCTVANGTYSTTYAAGKTISTALGEIIKTAAAGSAALEVLLDDTGGTGLFKGEISDPKAWLADNAINGSGNVTDPQTGNTYVTNSFANPYSTYSDNSRTATRALGYTGGRNFTVQNTFSANLFAIATIAGSALVVDGDEEATKANVRALAYNAVTNGMIVSILGHDTGEVSAAEWGWILDALAEYPSANLMVTSMQLAVADILANDDSYTNGVSTKAYSTYTDSHLLSGSPAINAAVDLCGTLVTATDYAGTPVCTGGVYVGQGSAPEIGLYEFAGGVLRFPNFINFPSFPGIR